MALSMDDIRNLMATWSDEDVRRMARAAKREQKRREAAGSLQFTSGQAVRFVQNVNPKLLAGRDAVVVGFTESKVVVDLLQPVGRWHRGMRCTPTILEAR